MAKSYSFSSDYVDIFLKEGIVWVVYKGNIKVTLDKAIIIVEERLKVANGKSYPTLSDCRKLGGSDKASRSHFASEAAMTNVTAGALIMSTPIQSMLINAYLWFDNPPIPTAVFSNEEKAVQWLQLFKITNN